MIFAVAYGLGGLVFLAMTVLMLVGQRPRGVGLWALALCVITAAWAIAGALQPWWTPGPARILDGLRSWVWLQFFALVLFGSQGRSRRPFGIFAHFIVPGLGLLDLVNNLRLSAWAVSPTSYDQTQVLLRIIFAILGLMMVENLIRNTLAMRRWQIFPLCIAAGGLFAFDLFVFAEAVIAHGVSPALTAARGLVLAFVGAPFAVAMARNRDWQIDIHVSQRAVVHTTTLTAGGIFLLAAAAAASMLGAIPGIWGQMLEATFFCGSLLVLAIILSTGSIRSRIARLVRENFFSRRYDYREEWMRFVETISTSDLSQSLETRVIRALAAIVDSPGGALWLADQNYQYRVSTCLNFALDSSCVETSDSPFAMAFQGGTKVQEFCFEGAGEGQPGWTRKTGARIWLAVPLVQAHRMIGFIVLAPPRAPQKLSWESDDLLRTLGRQTASYLSEERATRALIEARSLVEYGKKFAFVAHDVKNLSNRLVLMASNLGKFGNDPSFRHDMLVTLENSARHLNDLLGRLRESQTNSSPEALDLRRLIADVAREQGSDEVEVKTVICEDEVQVELNGADIHSALTHLVNNAVEASRPRSCVEIRLHVSQDVAIIEVEDHGEGMDQTFVKSELFAPLRSTKPGGHGIGAYQAREIVRAAGGYIEVTSEVAKGTVIRIMLPRARAMEPAVVA